MAVTTKSDAATRSSTATGTSCCCCDGGGLTDSRTSTSDNCLRRFTDSEWAAARELVRLSVGAAPSSARPSAVTPRRVTPLDELREGPRTRRQRRRTLASLYQATSTVAVRDRGDGKQKRKRALGDGDVDVYACLKKKRQRRDGSCLIPAFCY